MLVGVLPSWNQVLHMQTAIVCGVREWYMRCPTGDMEFSHSPFVCFFGVYTRLTCQGDLDGLENWQIRQLVYLRNQFLHTTNSYQHICDNVVIMPKHIRKSI